MKRLLIPVSFLNEPLFQELLREAEEFGYYHSMGGLTLPCMEDVFLDIASHLKRQQTNSNPRFKVSISQLAFPESS
ncbi:Auxin-induced protein X10A [Glycine soja]|nr:Auxin-induced protein X10A [Glycine soja]